MTDASTARGRETFDIQAWLRAAGGGDALLIKSLLAAGADPNAAPEGGETALIRAASKGHLHVVRLLLAAGADPNAEREDGFTALSLAVFLGYADIVRALLAGGADPAAQGRLGKNVEKWAVFSDFKEIIEMLRNPDSVRAQALTAEAGAEAPARPTFFPAEGAFSPVVPLSEIGEAESEGGAAGEQAGVKEFEVGAGARAAGEAEEREVATVVRPRARPASEPQRATAPLPSHDAGPRGSRRLWPVVAASLALLLIAALASVPYWKGSRRSAQSETPAEQSSPAIEAGTRAPEPEPEPPAETPAPAGDSVEAKPAAGRSSELKSDAAPPDKTSRPRSAPAADASASRRVSAARADADRETTRTAVGVRPAARGVRTADTGRGRGAPRRPRSAEGRMLTSASRESSLPVFSPKPASRSEKKVVPWP